MKGYSQMLQLLKGQLFVSARKKEVISLPELKASGRLQGGEDPTSSICLLLCEFTLPTPLLLLHSENS